MQPEERYKKGVAKLVELLGPVAAEKRGIVYEMAPEFAELTREFLFGAIWSDPTLETRLRSIATLSALVVLDRQPEVRLHLRVALNLGFTKAQLIALITHLSIYGGYPVTMNALMTAKEVFARWDAKRVEPK